MQRHLIVNYRNSLRGILMRHSLATVVLIAMLALAACSSSSGDGSHPPDNVTVVVPPN